MPRPVKAGEKLTPSLVSCEESTGAKQNKNPWWVSPPSPLFVGTNKRISAVTVPLNQALESPRPRLHDFARPFRNETRIHSGV